MFNIFNLAAIVRGLRGLSLALISMDRHVQSELARSWWQQYRIFTEGVDEVDIDIGYKPDAHERFVVRDYDLPGYLQEVDSRSMLPVTTMQTGDLDNIVALCGVVSSDDGEYLLFQKFRRPQVIKPGLTLLLQGDTYHSIERPGLTLDRKICAVFSRNEGVSEIPCERVIVRAAAHSRHSGMEGRRLVFRPDPAPLLVHGCRGGAENQPVANRRSG